MKECRDALSVHPVAYMFVVVLAPILLDPLSSPSPIRFHDLADSSSFPTVRDIDGLWLRDADGMDEPDVVEDDTVEFLTAAPAAAGLQ
mgnify:CR=1 FL=1